MAVFLNKDISFDVLSRLPAKTLLGVACISRQAKQLISDRTFIQASLKPNEPLSGFFYQRRFRFESNDIRLLNYISIDVESPKLHNAVFSFLHEDVVILGSCNGLVCLRSCLGIKSQNSVIYVCNPASREFVVLSWPEPCNDDSFGLAFDPFCDEAAKSTDYKVVRVRRREPVEQMCFSFDIYSSETGSWKLSKESCCCDHSLFKNKGIFIAGALYWLTDGDMILMFNVEMEFSYLIRVPWSSSEVSYNPQMCIGESDGQLHFAIVSECGLQLWVLKDFYSHQWDIIFSVSLEELGDEDPKYFIKIWESMTAQMILQHQLMDPLAFKDGLLFMRVKDTMLLYNIQTRKVRPLCSTRELGEGCASSPAVIPYSLSLVLPKCD